MNGPTVAIVHLGRASSMGQVARVRSWSDVLVAAGAQPVSVPLQVEHRATPLSVVRASFDVMGNTCVPETLSWSIRSLSRRLADLRSDAVVLVTLRAWHPSLDDGTRRVMLDYVDRLSVSYRQRADVNGGRFKASLWRALARRSATLENRRVGRRRAAAGMADARELDASWIPNTVTLVGPPASADATHDIVFVGTLSYAPNVDAIARLGTVWPQLKTQRPEITALIAGRAPCPRVRRLCATHGWTLLPDFADSSVVFTRGRLSVAPLQLATGIQNKVLEAAAAGVAQIITPEVAAGFDSDLPAAVAESNDDFVSKVLALLDDRVARTELAVSARQHVERHYSPSAWADPVKQLLLD